MKLITVRAVVFVFCFIAGTAGVFIFLRSNRGGITAVPAVSTSDPRLPSACFPGMSKEVTWSDSASYFPPNAFDPKSHTNQIRVDWYSKFLIALGENPLYYRSKDESYRFL